MSLREIWQNLSVDTLFALPPSEFLALSIILVAAVGLVIVSAWALRN